MFQASLPESSKEIMDSLVQGSRKQQYTPSLRSFALTLHFYSAKAYGFVREKFNKSLPHPRSIRNELNDDHNYLSSKAWHLTLYACDIIAYIAGFVVRVLKRCVVCEKCLQLLESPQTSSKLQFRKQYGTLINASPFVIDICKAAERQIRMYICGSIKLPKKLNVTEYLKILVFRHLRESLFDSFQDHIFDDDPLSNHSIELPKLILQKYINLRLHHETQSKSAKSERLRSRKTILFRNE